MTKQQKCYDCKKTMFSRGVTVGRMSCPTIWASICFDCVDKLPCSEKQKKTMVQQQMIMNELVVKMI